MTPGTRLQKAFDAFQAEARQAVADASMQIGKTKNASMAKMIAEERQRQSLSLQQVADLAGITKSHMWEMEQGRAVNPTVSTVFGIAKALSLPFVELAAGALNDIQKGK